MRWTGPVRLSSAAEYSKKTARYRVSHMVARVVECFWMEQI